MKRFVLVGSMLLILCIGLTSFGFSQGEETQSTEVIKGKVICLGCTLKKEQGAKADCSVYGHKHGLRTDDGKIWSFLENDNSADLIQNHDYNGSDVEITGRKLDNAQIIEVESFKIAPEEGEMAPEAPTHMHMAPEAHSH